MARFQARVAGIVARSELPEVRCWEDAPDKRIKIQFRLPPDAETCNLLYRHGFRFRGGIAQYWIRKLDSAGRKAASLVMAQLTERTEDDNR